MSFSMGEGSRLSYYIDYTTNEDQGSLHTLTLAVKNAALHTSLYSHKLIEAHSMSVSLDMPSPRRFNALRTWKLDIVLQVPVINLLRAHHPYFNKLSSSWNFNDCGTQYTHVPVVYDVHVALVDFSVLFNIND
ncbi:hypothetical protein SARC_12429, partial [Sphaeroforma arctica JP610]